MLTAKSMSVCALGLLGLGIGLVDVEAGETSNVCHDRMLHVIQAPRDEIFICDEWKVQYPNGPTYWDCDKEGSGWSEGGTSTQWRLRDDYVKSGKSYEMPWLKGVRVEGLEDAAFGTDLAGCHRSTHFLMSGIKTCEHGVIWKSATGCPSAHNHGGSCYDKGGSIDCMPDPNPPTTTTTKPTTTTTQTTTTTTTTTTAKPTTSTAQPTTTEGTSGPQCDDLSFWGNIVCKDLEDGSVEFTTSPGALVLGEPVAFVNGAHFVDVNFGCTSELEPTERSSIEYCLNCDGFISGPCPSVEDASLRGGKRA